MSTSRNKSRFTGLRILWIPGRKKHGRKGHYESTNKRVDYSAKQKPNEPWSLGGSKGQEELIRTDISGHLESPVISSVLPASCAIAVNVPQPEMKLDEETNKFAMLDTFDEDINNEQQHHVPTEFKQSEKHNGTLPINDKKDPRQYQMQGDVNSIEHIGEKSLNQEKGGLDRPDGSLYNVTKQNNNKRKNKKKKKKNKSGEENHLQDEEEDEKVVTCLYYTLMCCECSIS